MDNQTDTQPQQRVTMTEQEFARTVGVSVTTCKVLRKKNKLAHFKVGRKILYGPEHVTQFLASVERNPRAA